MTLNGCYIAPVCLASDRVTFENNCVKTNKDRHTPSVAQIFARDSSFWQYKVYADIRAGSLEKRHQRAVWSRVTLVEHPFLDFENNYVKVNTDRPIL